MSQSPQEAAAVDAQHPYAEATNQLNQLVRQGRAFSGHERNCCYLNTADGRFANASAVSGFDFPEDGRCIVRTDWDFDGDLDFWVSNRTGPRLRFLRNNCPTDNKSLAFRLRGVESNRDAIGASVSLTLSGAGKPTNLTQSVRRGEGFLGQSTSWVTFGLGDTPEITRLEVLWPTGEVEAFPPPEPGGYYELVEGTGQTSPWEPPKASQAKQAADDAVASESSDATQHLLSQPLPLPPLRYETFAGESRDASTPTGEPVLLNLWASWCRPCLVEMKAWSKESERFEAIGLRVLALSVDGLENPEQRDESGPRKLQERLGFAFDAGMAAPRTVQLLQLINNLIYQHDHRPLPVPTSLLIDGEGRLAAIYKGPVSIERLAKDVRALGLSDEERMRRALPFAGQWIGVQGPHRILKLAAAMWDAGLGEETIAYAEGLEDPLYQQLRGQLYLDNASRLRDDPNTANDAAKMLQAAIRLNPSDSEALMELGVIAAQQGDIPKAIELLEQAVQHADPPSSAAHYNLGKAYRVIGRVDQAKQQLLRSVRIDPSQPQALEILGHLFVAEQNFKKAAEYFGGAWRIDSSNKNHLTNLVTALMQTGEAPRARTALEEAIARDPQDSALRVFLAQVLLQQAEVDRAVALLEQVTREQPKATRVWYLLAQIAQQRQEWRQSVGHLKRLFQLAPEEPAFQSELAWLLAVAPEETLRDADLAVKLAERAVKTTKGRDWRSLDVLAAAYAEQGRYDRAAQAASEAIKLLSPSDAARRGALGQRLELYRQEKPYRLPSGAPSSGARQGEVRD